MQNIRKDENGWIVRFERKGQEYSKYFRFSNGGIRKALTMAKAWRDEQLVKLGPRKWKSGPNKAKPINNTSGIVGVSKNRYNRWVAAWKEDGIERFKTFRTKREAVSDRRKQISQLV